MRDAMIVYGDICGCDSFTAPFVWGLFAAFAAGLLVRDADVLLAVRLTGAEATEAAGILDQCGRRISIEDLVVNSKV